MMDTVALFVATGLGLGWLPWAPGTFGALIGLPLAWWVMGGSPRRQMLLTGLFLAGAVPLCHWASLLLGGGDASQIVADEYLAFPLAVLGLPMARYPWLWAASFGLYRLLDATKPPPIDQLEAIGSGLGIVLDDVMAAIGARLVLAIGIAVWRRYRSA